MIYEFECKVCHREFEEFAKVDERDNVECCGVKALRLLPSSLQHMIEEKYQFNRNNGKETKWISSRQQYKKALKEEGLVDLSRRDMMSIKPFKDPYKQKRKEAVNRVFKQAQKDGIDRHKVGNFMKDVLKTGKGVKNV